MENYLIYFAKVNGLLILFYLMYVLFLRKETFFTSNRWYLLTGLFVSITLPLLTFTKTIWIETTPIPEFQTENIMVDNLENMRAIQEPQFDWSVILLIIYGTISLLILLKIGIELASFFKKISNQNIQKLNNYSLVDSNSTENPFSFFNYIVINKNRFSENELQHILTHESIHVAQKHSLDVLLSKLFCALLWVNPIIWLYRKAILQNLEYIADKLSFEQIENKYDYQITLLKVVTHQHNLSITNQFYQSLIKKRIVMLHTNQSHKRNVLKYAFILPVLVGFMLLFQVETVAQVKENINTSAKVDKVTVEAILYFTDKNATDTEMKADSEELKKQGIEYKFSKIKRNKNGEIIAIKIEFDDNKGTTGIKEIKGKEPIEPIYFSAEKNKLGFTNAPDLSDYIVDEKLSKQFGSEIKVKVVKVSEFSTPPTPPTPPDNPYSDMIEAPTPPDLPNAPDLPSNLEDEKAMAKYEKAMASFEKKMKAIEPKMKEFEKKMEVFEKEMKLKEPDLKKFEQEMKIFENKMKNFEKEMGLYEKENEQQK